MCARRCVIEVLDLHSRSPGIGRAGLGRITTAMDGLGTAAGRGCREAMSALPNDADGSVGSVRANPLHESRARVVEPGWRATGQPTDRLGEVWGCLGMSGRGSNGSASRTRSKQNSSGHAMCSFVCSGICGRRTGCLSFQNTCTSARTRLADGPAAAEPEKDRCAQLSPNGTRVKPLVVTAIINAAVASANR